MTDMERNSKTIPMETIPKNEVQQVDLPEKLSILWTTITFLGMAFYLLDIASDVYVAVGHYISGKYNYFVWTLVFIVPSIVITNLVSLLWYLESFWDKDSPKATAKEWGIRAVFLLFQLGLLLRYIDTYRFGRRSNKADSDKKKKDMYSYMTFERADTTLIILFECFLEAAPQMVLQIYTMRDPTFNGDTLAGKWQYTSCGISLVFLCLALVCQQRALRLSHPDAKVMSYTGSFVQFWSHMFIVGSRVLTFGLFASFSLSSFLMFCFIHCSIMTTWIFLMKTKLTVNKVTDTINRILFGIAYIFCHVNLESSPSRRRLTVFNLITLSENAVLICVWYFYGTAVTGSWELAVTILVILAHVLGLVLLVIYYKTLHPNKDITPYFFCWSSEELKGGKEMQSLKDEQETIRERQAMLEGHSISSDKNLQKKTQKKETWELTEYAS